MNAIPPAAHQPHLTSANDLVCSHLIEGERAGFVRADHGRRPQRLHRMKSLHDGVLFGHFRNADCKRHGDDRRQPFRDSGNRERNRTENRCREIFLDDPLNDEYH